MLRALILDLDGTLTVPTIRSRSSFSGRQGLALAFLLASCFSPLTSCPSPCSAPSSSTSTAPSPSPPSDLGVASPAAKGWLWHSFSLLASRLLLLAPHHAPRPHPRPRRHPHRPHHR